MNKKRFYRLFFAVLFTTSLIFSSCTGSVYDFTPAPESPAPSENQATLEQGSSPVEIQAPGTPAAPLPEDSSFTVYFLDVGQGDSALVECDGKYMLIDGGRADSSSLLYSFLKKNEIDHLDYVIGTHKHEDHIGGIAGALNFASAGKVYCSETKGETKAFDNFVKAVKKQGLAITVPEPVESFDLGSALVEMLAPINFKTEDTNQLSIVLKVTYGETSFLFTADAGREEEQGLLDAGYDLECNVLKVGHHGSNSSTTYPFLREVMPEYAVIPVGKNNDYGHPTEDVLSRLRDAGVTVYRTDLDGDVTCRSDGKTVTIETQKQRPS